MTTHTASCRCGQLRATATGEPVRVSVCHCLNCQKRSGSAFAAQVRFEAEDVTIEGRSSAFSKEGDEGRFATFRFCPDCGSDVYYDNQGGADGQLAIPLGAFDNPKAFTPDFSVWEERKHPWTEITGTDIEHYD